MTQMGDTLTYPIHAVAGLFPPMGDEQFNALVADIRQHGQREPITLHDGAVVDGVHRLRACEQLGISPLTKSWDGGGDLTAYVVSLNLQRRHLNTSQRAMVAARIANLSNGRPRRETVPSGMVSVAVPEAAAMMGVSRMSVERARTVQKKGTPELVKAVESGEIKGINTAARAARMPAERQMEVARAPKAPPTYRKPRRQGDLPASDRIDRAVATLETISDVLRAATPELKHGGRKEWVKPLRVVREAISRLIRICEAT